MKHKHRNKKVVVKLVLAGTAFLVLAAVCVYTVFIRPNLTAETVIYMESQVQSGSLVQGIIESGSITLQESHISYDLDINYSEDEEEDEEEEEASRYLQIEEVYAVQGQRMQEGDPLFKLSQDSIAAVRRKLQKAKSEAQLDLADARSEYSSQARSAKSTYSTSKAEADTASRTYETSVNRLQQEIELLYGDIQVLEAEINDYNEKLTDEDTLEEYSDLKYAYEKAEKKLEETDASSVAAYTANYSGFQSAKTAFEALDDTLQGYRDSIEENQEQILKKLEQINTSQSSLAQEEMTAQQTYDSAVLGGNLAGDIYGYTLDSLQDTVDEAQAAVDEAGELLEEFEAFVGNDGIIYADGTGLVTDIAYEAGDKLMNTGVMLSYATGDAYTITIDVSEEDISYIKVGDTVDIICNAYPDETYEGTVAAVTTSADSGYTSTVNYPVTIQIEGDTGKLYGGMTADITFVTDSVEDVLYISAKAVVTAEDGSTGVYVKNNEGEMELKPVETGFSNGSEVEITSGLSEGDTVYIASTVSAGQSEESLKQSGSARTDENAGSMPEGEESGQQRFPAGMEAPGNNSRENSPQGGVPDFSGPGMP
nr:HlyD family efflux transporter periplasmic adaptor subunit [uncultured Eisenbergiella sp.]